jgi:hypothetical protein
MVNDGIWPNMNVERRMDYQRNKVRSVRYWTTVRYPSIDNVWRLKKVDLERDCAHRGSDGDLDPDEILQEFLVLVHKVLMNPHNMQSPADKNQENEFVRIDRKYGYR